MRLIDVDTLLNELELFFIRKEKEAYYIGERGPRITWNDAICFIKDAPIIEGCGTKWIPCSERLPEDNVPVNITWVNRKPEYYYKHIKDVPFTATGVFFQEKWYWYSSTIEDYLAEYGRAEWDEIEESMHKSIEVIAWMPLPKPYTEDTP